MTTFSEAMAEQVLDLRRQLAIAKNDVRKARRSRDQWRARYDTAAAACHRLQRNYYARQQRAQ